MSIEALKQELAALPEDERRRVQAFLVALEDSNAAHQQKISEKIDTAPQHFATLEDLDRQLKIGPYDKL